MNPILLSGLVGAIVGASAAITAQFVSHRLASKRELIRFQIQSFERFRREFSEDENLRQISIKKEPLTDDEIDDYLGFFEEIGLYFHRNSWMWNWSMRSWVTQSLTRGKMSTSARRSALFDVRRMIVRISFILSAWLSI